jgi:hypothetical protein
MPVALSDGDISWEFGGLMIARTNAHFLATDWYPVTDEEITQCALHLESEVYGDVDYTTNEFDANAFVYDTAITLQSFAQANAYTDEILYEVSWYVHPSGEAIEFSVQAQKNTGSWETIKNEQQANPVTGNAGYQAWVSHEEYSRMRIQYNGETFSSPVIQKEVRR